MEKLSKEKLLAVSNYVLLQMENPHDSLHLKVIEYFNVKESRQCSNVEYRQIADFLQKKKGFIEKIGNISGYPGAQYKLTEKGKDVVSSGSIKKYDCVKRKIFLGEIFKNYIFNILTICIAAYALYQTYYINKQNNITTDKLERRIIELENNKKVQKN